jgi:hypothetical protein
MSTYNLTVQMEKYDPVGVEEDIQNLDAELGDEHAVNETLSGLNSAERTDAVNKFLEDNKVRIADQHARMASRVKDLSNMVKANQLLETADANYTKLVESDEAQYIARLLTEMNAMSIQYRDLLLASGRAGRPPLF